MIGRARTSRFRFLAVAFVAIGLAACGSEAKPSPGSNPPIDAAAYSTVIAEFLPPVPPEATTRRVVYVAGVSDATLSLEDQVAVIDGFAETHDVRFVDDFAAAVDSDLPGAPPKDEGVLIGVGKIDAASPHTVRVEIYIDAEDIEARKVTISKRGDIWVIVSVEPVEPEVLDGDE